MNKPVCSELMFIFLAQVCSGHPPVCDRPLGGSSAICETSLLPRYGAFDPGLAVSVPLPIVTGIFVLLWFQSRLT